MNMLRIMRWARHVAHMERREIPTGVLWESQKVKDHKKLLDGVGKMILKRIFQK
jgi:hypothetical protein